MTAPAYPDVLPPRAATDDWELRHKDIERFATRVADCRVTDRGCWEWAGIRFANGYGRFDIWVPRRRALLAHRVAFLISGRALTRDAIVMHACDNPPCCNPEHLQSGTPADNTADMHRKGRGLTGSRHPMARLTPGDVADIRRRRSCGETLAAIAAAHGISFQHVSDICSGRRWRD